MKLLICNLGRFTSPVLAMLLTSCAATYQEYKLELDPKSEWVRDTVDQYGFFMAGCTRQGVTLKVEGVFNPRLITRRIGPPLIPLFGISRPSEQNDRLAALLVTVISPRDTTIVDRSLFSLSLADGTPLKQA